MSKLQHREKGRVQGERDRGGQGGEMHRGGRGGRGRGEGRIEGSSFDEPHLSLSKLQHREKGRVQEKRDRGST